MTFPSIDKGRASTGAVAATLGLAAWFALAPLPAQAQGIGLIRDSEIEDLMRDYARPIFQASGLGAQNIKIHIVNDRSFNAFVLDGQNMFLHLGTLTHSDTPNQVIGVVAHEAGHIAGGHLSRLRQVMSQARSTSLMLQILGVAAMAAGAMAGAGGEMGQAGSAVMLGGQSMTMRTVLAYRRAEESAADQAAVSYLNATRQSARGMLETFEYFADQGLTSFRFVDPYLQSHPMPQERMAQLRDLARASPYFDRRDPPELQARHDLVRAKISGFRDDPNTVFNRYPSSDTSLPARYARAIATKQRSGVEPFLPMVDELIAERPNNPYFHEIKGQFLFEAGRAREAIAPLRRAVELSPDSPLIRIRLAQAQMADGDGYLDEAIDHLRRALAVEDTYASGYRHLATAYGRKGQIPEAELASAQAYLYEGKVSLAKQQAERAKSQFQPGSAAWLRADDIVNFEPPKPQ